MIVDHGFAVLQVLSPQTTETIKYMLNHRSHLKNARILSKDEVQHGVPPLLTVSALPVAIMSPFNVLIY